MWFFHSTPALRDHDPRGLLLPHMWDFHHNLNGRSGDRTRIARSIGRRSTHWATHFPFTSTHTHTRQSNLGRRSAHSAMALGDFSSEVYQGISRLKSKSLLVLCSWRQTHAGPDRNAQPCFRFPSGRRGRGCREPQLPVQHPSADLQHDLHRQVKCAHRKFPRQSTQNNPPGHGVTNYDYCAKSL